MSVSTQDFNAPFDPTAYTQISGAQLLQLITGASPGDDRGIFVFSQDTLGVPDVPNASSVTKYQRCAWIRLGATAVTVYVWNPASPNADPTLLFWNSLSTASIGAGEITTSLLANQSVTDEKIVSMDASKLTGSLPANILATLVSLASACAGDLAGSTWANPIIANGVVSTAKLADGGVTASKLASDAVETAKIKDANVTSAKILDGAVATAKIADANVTLPKLKADIINDATTVTPASGDLILLGDASDSNNTKKGTVSTVVAAGWSAGLFTSAETAIPASGAATADIPHSLGAIPSFVRCVLKCKSAEFGFNVDDEVPIESFGFDGANDAPAFVCKVDITNFKVVRSNVDATIGILRFNATIGDAADITAGNWRIKIYARL